MMPLPIDRNIVIRGPMLADAATCLWQGNFEIAFDPKNKPIGDLARNLGMRVLSQDAEIKKLRLNSSTMVDFHDPRLLQAAVKFESRENEVRWLTIAGSSEDRVLPLNQTFDYPGIDNKSVAFSDVQIIPAPGATTPAPDTADWPSKQAPDNIEKPLMVLARGNIPIGIWKGESDEIENKLSIRWPSASHLPATLFDGLCKIAVRKKNNHEYIPVRLVPEGIELDVLMLANRALPTGSAGSTVELALRVRLEPDPKYRRRCRLMLIGGTDVPQLRKRLDDVMHEFSPAGSMLFVDVGSGLPPLYWLLEQQGGSLKPLKENAWTAHLDTRRVRATLRTEPPRGAQLPASAELRLQDALIEQESAKREVNLQLACNEVPHNDIAIRLEWNKPKVDISQADVKISFGNLTTPADPAKSALTQFDAIASTRELDEILRQRYAAANILPVDARLPTYAFLPLERGQLQLRLPTQTEFADADTDAKNATPLSSAFVGLIRSVMPIDQTTAVDRPLAAVEITAGSRYSALVKITRAPAPAFSGSIVVSSIRGQLSGALWCAESSPSPAEVLPTLEAGPAALRAVPLIFGQIGVAGWAALVDQFDRALPATITLTAPTPDIQVAPSETIDFPAAIAWLSRSKLPLVAAINMTRTAGNALRPSISRDLVPFRVDGGRGGGGKIALVRRATGLPEAVPNKIAYFHWPVPQSPGEEAPETGVPFVPVTLPGIELRLPAAATDSAFGTWDRSLRYDLPILGELFAGATLKREENAATKPPPEIATALDLPAMKRAWERADKRLALTRTHLDRVIPWGSDRATFNVTTLAEPFIWTTSFSVLENNSVKLPIGQFTLGGQPYEAGSALEGLNGKITVDRPGSSTKVDVEVTGFAVRMRGEKVPTPEGTDSDHLFDTRGFGLQVEPEARDFVSWRAGRLDGSVSRRYVTTREPIELQLPWSKMRLSLLTRDLPMEFVKNEKELANDEWTFSGNVGMEAKAGSSGNVFKRQELVRSVYEWRFIVDGPTDKSLVTEARYAFPFGPFRFRPLRLYNLKLASTATSLKPKSVIVIGTLGPPDIVVRPTKDMITGIPRDEQAYRSGNLVALTFTASGNVLELSAIEDAQVVTTRPHDLLTVSIGKPARVAISGTTKVVYTPVIPGAEASSLPFALQFKLELDGGALKATDVKWLGKLFGQDVVISGKDAPLAGDTLAITFPAQPQALLSESHIRADSLDLSWKAGDEHATLTMAATAVVGAAGGAALVKLSLDGKLKWMSSAFTLDRTAGWNIDHQRGVIETVLKSTSIDDTSFIRGLPLPNGTVTGIATLAVAEQIGSPQPWPDFKLSAGLVEFIFKQLDPEKPEDMQIRQRLVGETRTAGSEWRSTILFSAGQRSFKSTVKWPIGAIQIPSTGAVEFKPLEGQERDWVSELSIAASTRAITHEVVVWIKDVELPFDLIGVENGKFVLGEQWRFKAASKHILRDGNLQTIEWFAINDLMLIDLAKLKSKVSTDTAYAFLGRFIGQATPNVAAPGIVKRQFARAGFPPKAIVEALKSSHSALSSLLITGAGVTNIETAPATGATAAYGVTLTLPWVAVWDDSQSLGILDDIPQAPPSGTAKISVSTYDIANSYPRPLNGPAPVPIRLRDSSAPALAQQLQAVFRAGELRAAMPVDQSIVGFSTSPSGKQWLERPIFFRSLCALKRIFGTFTASATLRAETVLASAGPSSLAMTVVLKTTETLVVEQPPPPLFELVVLSPKSVSAVRLPNLEAAQLNGDKRRAVGQLAFSCASEPLAIAVAEIDDPRNDPPGLALHKSRWTPIELPVQLDAPVQSRRLRERKETVLASAALGWPASGRAEEAADLPIRLGGDQPIQDRTHAWAGRTRSFATKARAWPKSDNNAAAFLAVGRRVLFRRPSLKGFRAPADRALTPVPPRTRIPLGKPILEAIKLNLAKQADEAKPLSKAAATGIDAAAQIAPMLPGSFEVIDTGVRPGVLAMEHDGLILTSGDARFDPEHERFGRPADRGPVVFRQVRAPRSTMLPPDEIGADQTISIARRRRTFVAQDELLDPKKLKLFKLLSGPAVVLRYLDYDGNRNLPQGALVSTTLRVKTPKLGRLSARWKGEIEIEVTAASSLGLPLELARLGLIAKPGAPPEGLRAELKVGSQRFAFATIKLNWVSGQETTRVTLTLSMLGSTGVVLAAANAALDDATADTPVVLVLQCASPNKTNDLPEDDKIVPLQQGNQSALQSGPPRIIQWPLARVPIDRPWLPVETATLIFGDPAYDRRLTSEAKSDSLLNGGDRFMLAADRAEYDINSVLHFAVGKLLRADPLNPPRFDPAPQQWSIRFVHQPKPRPNGEARKAVQLLVAGTALIDGYYKIDGGKAYAFALASLRATDDCPAQLEPGDRLVLEANAPNELRLDVGIVPDAVIEPAEAAYSLVTLHDGTSGQSATASLFASAPLPQVIEYPDLIGDLAVGLVRRRALFIWYFVPRSLPAASGDKFGYLVKFDRAGGGQLPRELDEFDSLAP